MENFITGFLGGIAVILIIYLKNFIQEKRFKKNFDISGKYITKYEDERDREIVTFTAPAEIKQKGNKVYGHTCLVEENRRWVLEGQISNDGYFYGIYHAEDSLDKGIGNFFLKIDKNRNMIGLWSGFDAVNDKITSGKYIFKPLFKNVTIELIRLRDIPSIPTLSNQQLGEAYLNNNILEDIINDKENNFGKIARDSNNEVIGFYLCYVIEKSQVESILNIPNEKIPKAINDSNKIGILKTIAINENYQGNGIGTILVNDSINEFKKRKISTICSVGWKSKYGINIGGVLTNLGFEQIVELKDYWKEDSINKGYNCPICGNPPCKCSAVIFNLNI